MLLFKPFQKFEDLLDGFTSWKESYEYFVESASSFVHSFIQNNEDYHESFENSQDQIVSSLDDDLGNSTTEHDNIIDQSDIINLDYMESQSNPISSKFNSSIKIFSELRNAHAHVTTPIHDNQNNQTNENSLIAPVQNFRNFHQNCDFITRLSLVNAHLYNANESQPQILSQNTSQNPPSIANISYLFGLNEKQRKIFAKTCLHLRNGFISRWRIQSGENNVVIDDSGYYMYLGGGGGTGKSRVINALKYYAECYGFPDAIMVVAHTGRAAIGCGGKTIHSAFKWKKFSKLLSLDEEDKLKWAPVQLLLIDEISMLPQENLAKISDYLMALKSDSRPFGGVSILATGDFTQLAPVGSRSVYKQHRMANSLTLWQMINESVFLTKSMRFAEDPEYGEIMERLRFGKTTQHDIDRLNTRVDVERTHNYIPTLVISHHLRHAFNDAAFMVHATHLGSEIHCFNSEISRGSRSQPFFDSELKKIWSMKDNLTENLPTTFNIFIGMHIMLVKNLDTSKKAANGTIGQITAIDFCSQYDETSNVMLFEDEEFNISATLHSILPKSISIYIEEFNCYYILKPQTYKIRCNIGSNLSFSIYTMPITPAYALTIEKIQGITFQAMALGPLKHSSRKSVQRSTLYVALSRVKTLNGLYLMEHLTLSDVRPPSDEVLTEIARLKQLEKDDQ